MHNRMTDDFLANLAAKQSRSIYPTQQNKKKIGEAWGRYLSDLSHDLCWLNG